MNAFNVFFPLMSTLSGILEIRDCKYRKYGTGDDELNPPPAPCCWSNPFKDLLFRGLLHLVLWAVSGLGDNIASRVKLADCACTAVVGKWMAAHPSLPSPLMS